MKPKLPADTKVRKLTDMQSLFVVAYLANGGNGKAAIKTAGYSGKYPEQHASKMIHKPHVRAAVMAQAADVLAMRLMARALHRMESLTDAESESVQFHAAKDLLDRAGFRAPERTELRVSGDIRIDLSPPSERQGKVVDGTHRVDGVEGEGGLKTKPLPSSTAHPLTTEPEKDEDDEVSDI